MKISPRPLKFIALVLRNFIRNIGCSRAGEDDMAARPVRDQSTRRFRGGAFLAGHDECHAQYGDQTYASAAKSEDFAVHICMAPRARGLREFEL
jgi:hypothetical protein